MEDTNRRTLPPEVARQLNDARHSLRLTIRAGAERCEISRSHFGNLVMGKRAPSVTVAHRLIDGLGLEDAVAAALLKHSVLP